MKRILVLLILPLIMAMLFSSAGKAQSPRADRTPVPAVRQRLNP